MDTLFTIRISGLRADLVIFSQKVLEVPYGTFVFCVVAQFSLCAAAVAMADSRVFDRYLRAACALKWPQKNSFFLYKSIPNDSSWLDASLFALSDLKGVKNQTIIVSISLVVFALLLSGVILAPIMGGVFYLYDWKNQIVSGWIDLQYSVVLISTVVTLLAIVAFFSFFNLTADEEGDIW